RSAARGLARRDRLELARPLRQRRTRLCDGDPTLHARHALADTLERRRERRVEHQCLRISVVEQVQKLVGPVAIVYVERRQPDLERREQRLEILGRVVQKRADARAVLQTAVDEVLRERLRALLELAPSASTRAADLRGALRNGARDGLPN